LPERLKLAAALNVSEWNAVFAGKSSFMLELLGALKTRSSPGDGAVPPQFDASLHVPLVVPVQTRVAANSGMATVSNARGAKSRIGSRRRTDEFLPEGGEDHASRTA
jgi:hypothetical protein